MLGWRLEGRDRHQLTVEVGQRWHSPLQPELMVQALKIPALERWSQVVIRWGLDRISAF